MDIPESTVIGRKMSFEAPPGLLPISYFLTADPIFSLCCFLKYGLRRKDHIGVGSSGYQACQPQKTAQAATADLKWSFAEGILDMNVHFPAAV